MTKDTEDAVYLARAVLADQVGGRPYDAKLFARALVALADELAEIKSKQAALAATMTYGPRDRQG